MRRLLACLATTVCASMIFAAGPATARNYDCSKPGNANKAECKSAAAASSASTPAPTAQKGAKESAQKSTQSATATTTTTKSARNYDCSKPGNKNKAACKGQATAAAASATPPAKSAATAAAPASTMASAKPAEATTAKANLPAAQAGKPTARCKDGTMSMSQHRSGTCSRHGGVADWLANVPG